MKKLPPRVSKRKSRPGARIIFITGTDTGVGKTLLTGLLCCYLQGSGAKVRAIKPICCGDRADIDFLRLVQPEITSDAEINECYFPEPLAPQLAAEKNRRTISIKKIVQAIRRKANPGEMLLVEGAGGVLVPLADGIFVADLIARLDCAAVVVARNRLGTINHTLLTVNWLQAAGVRRIKVVLMGQARPDRSAESNVGFLRKTLVNCAVYELPYLGGSATKMRSTRVLVKKNRKTLALISDLATF